MDAHTQIPSRLRLQRNSFSFAAATLDENDSHLIRDLHYEHEDDRSTPRINGISKLSVDSYSSQSDFGESARAISTPAPNREDTPAARLRALLARADSVTPKAKPVARPRSPSLSGLESDFASELDASTGNVSNNFNGLSAPSPNHGFSPSPPGSVAHKSVRDIFSKARMDLATPEKPKRTRRNSIGPATQESPITVKESNSWRRRVSFSDDEIEKTASDTSRTPHAYESLRQRTELAGMGASTSTDASLGNSMNGFGTRHSPLRSSTPPNNSTRLPLAQSISQFPSQFASSNLMNEDSDMQKLIRDIETDTASEGHTDNEVPYDNKRRTEDSPKRRSPFSGGPTLTRLSSMESMSLTHSRPSSRQSDRSRDGLDNGNEGSAWGRPLSSYMDRHHTGSLKPTTLVNGFSRRGKIDDELSALSDSSQTDHEPYRRDEPPSGTTLRRETSLEMLRLSPALANGSRYLGEPNGAQSLQSSTGSNETQKPDGRLEDDSVTARPRVHRKGGPVKTYSVSAATSLYHGGDDSRNRSQSTPGLSPHLNTRPTDQADDERGSSQDYTRSSLHNWNSMRHSGVDGLSPQQIGSPEAQEDGHERTSRSISSRSKLSTIRDSPLTPPSNSGGANYRQEQENDRSSASRIYDVNSSPRTISPKYSSFLVPQGTREEVDSIEDIRRQSKSPIPLNHRNGQDSLVSNRRRIPELPSSKPEVKNTNRGEQSTSSVSLASFASQRINEATSLRSLSKAPLQHVNGYTHKAQQRSSMAIEPITLHDSDIESFNEEDIAASSPSPRRKNSYDPGPTYANTSKSYGGIDIANTDSNIRDDPNMSIHDSSQMPDNFSPPPSPPMTSDKPAITTPQRHSRSISRIDYHTPPRPPGMPALPEPPTPTNEGSNSDQSPPRRTAATPASRTQLTDMKTPRPPGAWATPFSVTAISRNASTLPPAPKFDEDTVLEKNGVYTPPASLSKATAMSLKTPAPPGAWVATPGTVVARRMHQKVRFDEDQTLQTPKALYDDSSVMSNEASYMDGSVINKGTKSALAKTEGVHYLEKLQGLRQTPALIEGTVKSEDRDTADEGSTVRKPIPSPGTRRSKIRMLDAMGNEIVEEGITKEQVEPKAEETDSTSFLHDIETQNLERKEALELLHKTITALRADFNRTDDPLSPRVADAVDAQIADLKARSIRALEERQRLLSKIQVLETGDLPPLAMGAASFRRSASARLPHYKLLWGFLVLQAIMLILFYRLTALGARRLFIKEYIDPYYHELYLHVATPDCLQGVNTSIVKSQPFLTFRPILGWIWNTVVERFDIIQETMWEVWGVAPRSNAWPPT